MLLHESLLYAIGADGASGLHIYCDELMKEEVAEFFQETFQEEWQKLLDKVEDEYGDCNEKDEEVEGAYVRTDENGVFVAFEPLAIYYGDGDFIADVSGDQALKKTLKKLAKKYPEIKYEGYIGYTWSDVHCGEIVQYEISSEKLSKKNERVYDFVGEALARMLEEDSDYFWEEMEMQLESGEKKDFKEVFHNLCAYSKWIGEDVFERLLEFAEEVDDEISEMLEKQINKWKKSQEETEACEDAEDDDEEWDDEAEKILKAFRKAND